MQDSDIVEISADLLWMRPRHGPERWAIEGTAPNTFSSLKVDVPEFVPGQTYFTEQETGKIWQNLFFFAFCLFVCVLIFFIQSYLCIAPRWAL